MMTSATDYSSKEKDGQAPRKVSVKRTACINCLSCPFCLLSQHRLRSTAYKHLLADKYLLTRGVTQCSCERSFFQDQATIVAPAGKMPVRMI